VYKLLKKKSNQKIVAAAQRNSMAAKPRNSTPDRTVGAAIVVRHHEFIEFQFNTTIRSRFGD
jgi:deoxycytidylate deaminase